MTELFIKLEQDNDIVMLGKDTFTVSRLKELMTENLKVRLFDRKKVYYGSDVTATVSEILRQDLTITDKSIQLKLNEFRLVFPPNGIECQLLQLKSGKWISGKIRFQVDLDEKNTVNVELEFAPDEIIFNEEEQKNINSDNSLDEIRAKLNEMNTL